MQTTKRQHAAVMIERLLAAPYPYRFAQLLNILVRILRQQGVPYAQAFSQVLRFRNSLSLAFLASEIESMQAEPIDATGASESALPRIHITPIFIGLLGASGILPLHDTERAATKASLTRTRAGSHSLICFPIASSACSTRRGENTVSSMASIRATGMICFRC